MGNNTWYLCDNAGTNDGEIIIDGKEQVINLKKIVEDGFESGPVLPYEFYEGSAVVYNGEIHILGGSGNYTKHYKYDGSTWIEVSTLPYSFTNGSAVVYNNEIHILGSYYDNWTSSTGHNYPYTEYHYKYDGSTWTSVSTLLPYGFYRGSAVVYNGEIHILGGSGNYTNHYKYNGSTWTSVSTLPYGFYRGSAVVYNGEIHILGSSSSSNYTNHYSYGNKSSIWIKENNLPYEFYNGSAVVYNDEIHIMGSGYGYSSRFYCKYNESEWTYLNNLPYEFYWGSAVVYDNNIYIIGGGDNNYTKFIFLGKGNVYYVYDEKLHDYIE